MSRIFHVWGGLTVLICRMVSIPIRSVLSAQEVASAKLACEPELDSVLHALMSGGRLSASDPMLDMVSDELLSNLEVLGMGRCWSDVPDVSVRKQLVLDLLEDSMKGAGSSEKTIENFWGKVDRVRQSSYWQQKIVMPEPTNGGPSGAVH